MSGCHTRQIANRKTIVCLLLLISMQAIANASSKMSFDQLEKHQSDLLQNMPAYWKRISRSDVHLRRLYDAYKDRLKEETDDNEYDIESNEGNKMTAGSKSILLKGNSKRLQHKHDLHIEPFNDTTDESQNEEDMRAKAAGSNHEENVHSDQAKADEKRPVIDRMVLVKLDVPEKKDTEPQINAPTEKSKAQLADANHQPNKARLAELNSIYNDYVRQYHKTGEEPQQHVSENAPREKDKPAQLVPKSARADVLNQLVNIIERMGASSKIDSVDTKSATNLLDESKHQPIASATATHADDPFNEVAQAASDCVAELAPKKQEEFNLMFQKIEPALSSNMLHRVAKEMLAVRNKIKVGGMYDEYKKRLYTILSEQGNANKLATRSGVTSERDFPIDSENECKANYVAQCKCESSGTAESAQALAKLLGRDKVENKEHYHQAAVNGYINALDFFANNSGGPNPYYLPNSKQRQLVWNEVPMLKKSGGTSPGKLQKNLASNNSVGKPKNRESSEANSNNGDIGAKFKTKNHRPATEDSKSIDAKKPYAGVDSKHIKAAVDAFQQASFSSLYEEYLKQLQNLSQMLKEKNRWWIEAQGKLLSATGGTGGANGRAGTSDIGTVGDSGNDDADSSGKRADGGVETGGGSEAAHNNINIAQQLASLEGDLGHINAASSAYPNVLTQSYGVINNPSMVGQSAGSGLLENMASQLNLSPVELAQRITNAGQVDDGHNFRNDQGFAMNSVPVSASPTSAVQLPIVSVEPVANTMAKHVENGPQVMMHTAPMSMNLLPVLDKILQRLQSMQESRQISDDDIPGTVAVSMTDRKLPCCFASPTDGTPCDIIGSWESMLLGIRINIDGARSIVENEPKMTCQRPKKRSAIDRSSRQCVKINSKQLKEMSGGGAFQYLNVSVQETVPPRSHDLIENVDDWVFNGYTVNSLGGPITLSCRKMGSNLIGTFIGYCRTCGCVDTIFGSWSFCLPSRDCQDITTSIFDRRDLLRRYNMDNKRKDRFKESLYKKSNFAKTEKHRQNAEHRATHKRV